MRQLSTSPYRSPLPICRRTCYRTVAQPCDISDRSGSDQSFEYPDAQRAFERNFVAPGAVKHAYPIRKNTFLLIDPDLRKALEFVKRARAGTPEEEREFVKNPRAAIARAFGADGFDGITTSLFIETKQYSEDRGACLEPRLFWH